MKNLTKSNNTSIKVVKVDFGKYGESVMLKFANAKVYVHLFS